MQKTTWCLKMERKVDKNVHIDSYSQIGLIKRSSFIECNNASHTQVAYESFI